MNTQLSHAESKPPASSHRRLSLPAPRPSNPRNVMIVLAVCMALQMTSFVMILPLFSRRFSELGGGVESLGASAMAFALAATLAAPFMGTLADRYGRRPVVLLSLAAYVLAFTGYLLASSVPAFILLRALAGVFTAGLIPAVNGIVADTAPVNRRAQWIGIVSGGAAVGWIAGPILGGLLYDHWGYETALIVAISMAVAAFITAYFTVPETHKNPESKADRTAQGRRRIQPTDPKASLSAFRDTLPDSLAAFLILLFICSAVMFAWAFIEPTFMFYAYDDLGWSSSMLGLVMSAYGIAMMLGEFGLSQLGDHIGRKRVIILGLVLFSAQFMGLAFLRNYMLIAVTFVIAGLGNALFDPAISASIIDIAPAEHRARAMGFKSTAGSLGNILGPALIVLFASSWNARGIFLISVSVVFFTILVGLTGKFGVSSSPATSQPDMPGGQSMSSRLD
jgi:MFS family permease